MSSITSYLMTDGSVDGNSLTLFPADTLKNSFVQAMKLKAQYEIDLAGIHEEQTTIRVRR